MDRISRGATQERFELLSDGTKEQIAVLTRLAMGSLLAERGQAVPIILDDALVYSDDERIERMFDALGPRGDAAAGRRLHLPHPRFPAPRRQASHADDGSAGLSLSASARRRAGRVRSPARPCRTPSPGLRPEAGLEP